MQPLEPLAPLGSVPRRRRRQDDYLTGLSERNLEPPSLEEVMANAMRTGRGSPQLTPEEEQSLLSKGGQAALSALGYLAETVDKPFSAMRGLMAGEPAQLANLIPFSDTLRLTNVGEGQKGLGGMEPLTTRKYSGRDVLETWGMLGPNEEGLDLGDVAGLAVDLLTPIPVPVGPAASLTKLGKLVSKAPAAERLVEAARAAGSAAPEALAAAKAFQATTRPLGEATRIGELALGATPKATEAAELVQAAKETGGAAGRLLGTTPAAMAEEIRQGLRAPLSIGLSWPWQNLGQIPIGAGSEWGAKLGEALNYGRFSPLRYGRALTNARVKGWLGPEEQRIRDLDVAELKNFTGAIHNVSNDLLKADKALESRFAEIAADFTAAGNTNGAMTYRQMANFLSQERSKFLDAAGNPVHLRPDEIEAMFTANPANAQKIRDFARAYSETMDATMSTIKDAAHQKFIELGGRSEDLADTFAIHWPRRPPEPEPAKVYDEMKQRLLDPKFGYAKHRKEPLRDVPEGRLTLDRLAANPAVTKVEDRAAQLADNEAFVTAALGASDVAAARASLSPTQFDQWLRQQRIFHETVWPAAQRHAQRMGQPLEDILGISAKTLKNNPNKAWEVLMEKSGDLADYFGRLKTAPEGLFSRSWVNDWLSYMEHLAISTADLYSVHNILKGLSVHGGITAAKSAFGEEGVSVGDLWRGMKTGSGKFERQALTDDGLNKFLQDFTAAKGIPMAPGIEDEIRLPTRTATAMQKYIRAMDPRSEISQAFMRWYDQYTALFKAYATLPRLAFHTRNRISGIWQNLMGEVPYGPVTYFKQDMEAARWLNRGGPEPKYLSEYALGGVGKEGMIRDLYDAAQAGTREGIPQGGRGWVLKPLLHPLEEGSLKPWEVRGFSEKVKEGGKQFFPLESGERAYQYVEFMNRYPAYAAAREAGWTPAQARELVNTLQYSYGAGTPAERNFFRKVIPFWGWFKQNIPYQIRTLATRPGGKTAQAMRLMDQLQDETSSYMPEWLAEQMAVRVGGTPEAAHFIRKFGLPIEDLSNIVLTQSGKPNLQRTAERLIAQSNPLISGAYKGLSGREPYTGRELKDLESVTGTNIPALDIGLQSLPVAPVLAQTYRTASDQRKPALMKAADLVSGVKFGTYDLEQQRLIELAQAQQQLLRENPELRTGEYYYIPERIKQDMTPQELAAAKAEIGKGRAINKAMSALNVKKKKARQETEAAR